MWALPHPVRFPIGVKFRNEARELKRKAIFSMRAAMTAFNSPHDDGRVTAILLHLQHSFEMLLKAALVQDRVPRVFDEKTGRSISFARCLHEARSTPRVRLTDEEAGVLRAVDAMRDDEQHWFTLIDEGLLYLHARAAVTLFDDLLHRSFGERLADYLPLRVLPIGSDPKIKPGTGERNHQLGVVVSRSRDGDAVLRRRVRG
jgi:hypothetical protein